MAQQMPRPMGFPGLQPGQQPSPAQVQQLQQQFAQEAARQGITPQQLAQKMQAEMQARTRQGTQQQQGQQQQAGQGQQQGQAPPNGTAAQMMQQPIQPGPPKPEALAVAKFLGSYDLKSRPCILQEKRKEMFKVKRALRALQSPAYSTARAKNPLLPEVTDRASAEQAFKLLPVSMLALRVTRLDSSAPKKKPPPGQKTSVWNVKIEPQQDCGDMHHYVWLYEGSKWRQTAFALLALLGVVGVVLYPLWPFWARLGVWYLSMGCLGLVAAFFGLAIVRLILFLFTVGLGPQPGIWIFPNLFEDVGFFDSFKPTWAWRETKESLAAKKAERRAQKEARREKRGEGKKETKKDKGQIQGKENARDVATTTGTQQAESAVQRRPMSATVEEVDDE